MSATGLTRTDGMYNLELSESAKPLHAAVIDFVATVVEPMSKRFFAPFYIGYWHFLYIDLYSSWSFNKSGRWR